MGMDVAHGHLWKLLLDTVEICRKTEKYRSQIFPFLLSRLYIYKPLYTPTLCLMIDKCKSCGILCRAAIKNSP